jgi:SAM-dependent methyltransferase
MTAQPDHAESAPTAAEILLSRKRTGTLPGQLLHLRHLAAYHLAATKFVDRGPVLELGSNLGYGAAFFSSVSPYLGIDLNVGDCRLAAREIAAAFFVGGDCLELPIRSGAVRAVLSFQVIEHVDDHRFLAEICRVLRPDGRVLLTTPNRALRLLPFQHPWNPEHLREYSHRSLQKLLGKHFADVTIMGLVAPPEILSVEQARVWQNPARVYLKMLGAPERMVARLARRLERRMLRRRRADVAVLREPASVETFSLDRTADPRRALDFFAVCSGPYAR